MSLLGKIFTVFILLASFGLMIVAMFVYATHKNWQQDYQAVSAQLAAARTENSELEAKYTNQLSQLKAEHEAAQQDVRKLTSELEEVATLNATIQTQVDQLMAQDRANKALVAATEDNNQRLFGEVQELRGSIAQNQQARDEAFAKTLEATTNLHVTANQLATLRERSAQLIKQLAEYTARLREGGIDPEGPLTVQARGKITRSSRADGRQLIEISLGYDDGIRPEQTVEIFRGDRYLGRARILRADPDVSVGQVLREFQQGQIQEQDDVATKLRVG